MFNKIDKLTQTEFTEVFGNIFENASWIALRLYKQKPFYNFNNLCEKIISIFEESDIQSKLKILNSHPDLANKTKIGSLTPDSNKEQACAGLDQCTIEEFKEFKNLNLKYRNNFGFPFILAVKGRNKLEILNNFKKRILSDKQIEFNEAIKQVKQIANLRLSDLKSKFI
jgi:2-oxo-4-hydroxy-4-carboxy-5-ureidoimidazoline decarboxylase